MKGKEKPKQDKKKHRKKSESKEEKRKPCNECKWYDWSTQRDFHRKVGPKDESGERMEIVEVRAVCRNPKAKACNRLVHAILTQRYCAHFEEGRHEAPKDKTKEERTEPISPSEYFGDMFEDRPRKNRTRSKSKN